MEELSLNLIQHSSVAIDLKVYDLSAFDVDHNLALIRARHQDPSLVRLPFRPSSVLASAFDLNQASTGDLDEDIVGKQAAVQR